MVSILTKIFALFQETYKLVEEGPIRRMSGASGILESAHDLDDEGESVTKTSHDQRAQDMEIFWNFTKNMLTNFGKCLEILCDHF